MNRKKVFLLLISLVMMSLFSGIVYAEEESFLPDIVEDTARFLFVDLGALSKTAPDTFVLYSKFIFFILVFSIFYWGASKAFAQNMRVGGTIAFIFAIIGTVMLPKSFMIFIFETYAQVIGFAFGILPFVIGLIISHMVLKGDETWQRILRGIIYILMAIFTFALVGTLRGFEDTLYIELAKWAEVGAFISLIVGVVVLIGSMGGGVGAGGAAGWIRDRFRGGGDGDRDRTPEERDRERRHERGVREAERLNDRLSAIQNQLDAELERDEYAEIEHIRELARLLRELVQVQEQLNRARRLR
ncbi:MAG: hypothetical protein IH934_00505 [Nanoarchaeota archaeon]|nr:hypothetical protein [Nanoarchaeota archaeon]